VAYSDEEVDVEEAFFEAVKIGDDYFINARGE